MNFGTCEASLVIVFWLSECHLTAHHNVTKWILEASVEREHPVFDIVVCSKVTTISVKTHLKCAHLSHCEPLSCSSLCRLLRDFLMLRWRWTNSWGDPVSVAEGLVSNCDAGNRFTVQLKKRCPLISSTAISHLFHCIYQQFLQPCAWDVAMLVYMLSIESSEVFVITEYIPMLAVDPWPNCLLIPGVCRSKIKKEGHQWKVQMRNAIFVKVLHVRHVVVIPRSFFIWIRH